MALLERAEQDTVFVPALWQLEIANQLGLRLRSGKLSRQDFDRAQTVIAALDIVTSPLAFASPVPVLAIMERFGLTAYDAVYLDCARTHHLPLATFDRQLIDAAKAAGIELI